MPRQARVIVPNILHHIVQRGHNKNTVFVEERNYQFYLDNLVEWKTELKLEVYSYCLMTNHVHLIVRANDKKSSIGELMKRLAGRQTRFVNKMERRTGSLWDSRYKISPIQTDEYLMQCCRYVELNPVKVNMVEGAEHYPWSSYPCKVGLVENHWLDLDSCFLSLDNSLTACRSRYADFVSAGIKPEEQSFIQQVVERNQLTGGSRFIDEVEARIGVRIECRGRGRPAKVK